MGMWAGGTARRIAVPLMAYGLAHAAVDAGCAALLLGAVTAGRIQAGTALGLFLVYNVVAFALQPIVGLLVDYRGMAKTAAIAGALLTASSLPLSVFAGAIVPAVLTAGVGNAIFHVGGGATSLRMTPGRASAPGLFVAPGAAGVAAGVLLGKAGAPLWIPAILLVACAAAMALVGDGSPAAAELGARTTSGTPAERHPSAAAVAPAIEGAVLLVLAVVALRSYAGLAIALPWKSSLPLLGALTAAVVLGKAAGGVLADRFGRARVGVGALAFSAPLLMLAPQLPVAGIVGMFAFNMTMPVTLVAVADVIPESPGFAFGLASLALAVGAFPVLAGAPTTLGSAGAIGAVVAVSATALAIALSWLNPSVRLHPSLSEPVPEVVE